MKTIKLISTAFLLVLSTFAFSQSSSTVAKPNVYLVSIPHTPEQCLNTLTDIKSKGDEFLAKFEWGCMSGDHTAYAFLEGKSESDVRQMLPKDTQASAKVVKVDKFTSDQIEKIHKDHLNDKK